MGAWEATLQARSQAGSQVRSEETPGRMLQSRGPPVSEEGLLRIFLHLGSRSPLILGASHLAPLSPVKGKWTPGVSLPSLGGERGGGYIVTTSYIIFFCFLLRIQAVKRPGSVFDQNRFSFSVGTEASVGATIDPCPSPRPMELQVPALWLVLRAEVPPHFFLQVILSNFSWRS